MKKRGVLLILVTLILSFIFLLLAMPFAFAVENATENETAECSMTFTDDYCPPTCSTDDDSDCCEQAGKCVVDNECTDCIEMICVDSDGGKDYYTAGSHSSCTPDGTCHYPIPCDRCLDDTTLIECYCEGSESKSEEYVCPGGCMDGVCLKEPEAQCGEHAECLSEEERYCEGSNACTKTTEYQCIEGECVADVDGSECQPCSYGCEEGVCLTSPEPEPRPTKCAAKISIGFDKNVYYVGEEFKAVMETFDAQGNHLPHYPFYVQIYDYENGAWKEIGQDRTDGDGYRIHQDKINMDEPLRFGKNKFRIYTKVYRQKRCGT